MTVGLKKIAKRTRLRKISENFKMMAKAALNSFLLKWNREISPEMEQH
jgi:hypothetical protein